MNGYESSTGNDRSIANLKFKMAASLVYNWR